MRPTEEPGNGGAGDMETAAIEAVDTLGLLRPETFERRESPAEAMRRKWVTELQELEVGPQDLVAGATAAAKCNYRVSFGDLVAACIHARNERERKERERVDPFTVSGERLADADVQIARIKILGELMDKRHAAARAGKPVGDTDYFEQRMREEFSRAGVGLGQVPLTRTAPPWLTKKRGAE